MTSRQDVRVCGSRHNARLLRGSISRILTGLCVALLGGVTPLLAAPLGLSHVPLYSAGGVPPNILLTLDDTGSMREGFIAPPGTLNSAMLLEVQWNTWRGRKSHCSITRNKIAYDPHVTYLPPVEADGTPLNGRPSRFTAAYFNGFNPGAGTVNLATGYVVKWKTNQWSSRPTDRYPLLIWNDCGTGVPTRPHPNPWVAPQPAFYYKFVSSRAGCSGSIHDEDCYQYVRVSASSGPGGTDERQNFANWYSYYSTRALIARSATGIAFSRLGGNVRVAGSAMTNTAARTGGNLHFTTSAGPMKPFSGAARRDFFERLYTTPMLGSTTPLRLSMKRAGDYYSGTGAGSPYRDVPGKASSPERSCRQNFHVLITDGYRRGGDRGITADADRTATSFPAPLPGAERFPYQSRYSPGKPYQYIYSGDNTADPDSTAGTVADNAFHYWSRDLRPDLTNNVPREIVDPGTPEDPEEKVFFNPKNDPAHWQHMVNYTVGLGVDGLIPYNATSYAQLLAGTRKWPVPDRAPTVENDRASTDDLWHAAVNSRGRYFKTNNSRELANALSATFGDLAARSGSASAAGTSTYYVNRGDRFSIYKAEFQGSTWKGDLEKYTVTVEGSGPTADLRITGPERQAASVLDKQATRNILAYNPSEALRGVPFTWARLNATQRAYLNDDPDTASVETDDNEGIARLEFLRGDRRQEGDQSKYKFRRRASRLGDIVDSAALYVGATLFDYPDHIETAPHSRFSATTAERRPMVYVGANDGMLHGFDADTLEEVFAYVPNAVFHKLNLLSSPAYQHRFYVNGSPAHGDAYLDGSWKTVLVGGLNGGGQGIYALDITDPARVNEGNAARVVLWEFTDADDPDLGYTFSEPVITRVRGAGGARWVAIFGNGYNNTALDGAPSVTGNAVLYVVDLATGALVKKISTRAGSAGTPNGLSSPSVLDWDGDFIVDYVYAGDLQGNLWKFDLTDESPDGWRIAFGSSGKPAPLFRAVGDASETQPITVAPEISIHPRGPGAGFMIFAGTGKLLEAGDSTAVDAKTQTIYGIWDRNLPGVSTPVKRADLLEQEVVATAKVDGVEYRGVTNHPMVWRTGDGPSGHLGWYLDLPSPGERQVSNLDLKGKHLVFTTYVPNEDPCAGGADGWQMELDYASGGRLAESPFDVGGDGAVCQCAADNVLFAPDRPPAPPAGRKGSPIERTILHGQGVDYKIEVPLGGSAPTSYKESPPDSGQGRQSWRQL